MKHISILIPAGGCILSSVVGTYKVLNFVNRYMEDMGKQPVFDIHLVGLGGDTTLYNGLFSIHPDKTINEVSKTNLIIIPAFQGDINLSLQQNTAFIPWIQHQYNRGAEVASLCTGAFLLASTGLLTGKTCTTHWMSAPYFREMFTDVKLVTEKIIVDEKGIYSSGGAFSFLNLILYLVEKYCGRHVAVVCAKVMEIEVSRVSQSPYVIFNSQKTHDDEPIKKAQQFIEQNVSAKISVDQLADMFAISRRNFERRFKKATSNTPAEYLLRVKMEAAKKSLETGRDNINDVMYSVGYTDNKAFRNMFKKVTGLSPAVYRDKYTRQPEMQVFS